LDRIADLLGPDGVIVPRTAHPLGWSKRVFQEAPQLNPSVPSLPVDAEVVDGEGISLTVVIPAFNESLNIKRSLGSVFQSLPPCGNWHVVVVDDMSTDSTADMAQECAKQMDQLNRFTLIQAGPRPADERWVGKNWACSKAMEQLKSSWVLFIDADVELRPTALRRALVQAIDERADLFSVAPRLVCTCLAEWMVQPIMASLLGLGFPIVEANDPSSDVAFAAGPFMLFRRSAYDAIGGHRALAGEVVEDLALARTIKTSGFRLRYVLGLDAVDLQMYPNLSALWEGWTKNWFLGLDRNIPKALAAGGVVVLMFASPWILLPTCAVLAVVLLGPTVMILRRLCWQRWLSFFKSFFVFGFKIVLECREVLVADGSWWAFGWCDSSCICVEKHHRTWLDLEGQIACLN